MRTTIRSLAVVMIVMLPSTAIAGPFSVATPTTWSSASIFTGDDVTSLALDIRPFWAGASWDGANKGILDLIVKEYGSTNGLEYLERSGGGYTSFFFDDPILHMTKFNGITAWSNGVFGRRADGAFTYDSGTGRISNSIDHGRAIRVVSRRRAGGDALFPWHRGHSHQVKRRKRSRLQRLRCALRRGAAAGARAWHAALVRFGDGCSRSAPAARWSQGSHRGDELSDSHRKPAARSKCERARRAAT